MLTLATVTALLLWVQLPYAVSGGYVRDSRGEVNLVLPSSADRSVLVVGYRLTGTDDPADRVGTAAVNAGKLSLWNWLYSKYVAPVWRW